MIRHLSVKMNVTFLNYDLHRNIIEAREENVSALDSSAIQMFQDCMLARLITVMIKATVQCTLRVSYG